MCVLFTRSCESTNVFCVTSCSLNDNISTNIFELFTTEFVPSSVKSARNRSHNVLICDVMKIETTSASIVERWRRRRFLQQRPTTKSTTHNFNFVNVVDNSSKTISMQSMHKIICRSNSSSISRRCCAFVDSTLVQQLWKIVLSESELVDASSSCVQSKAIQVRSMSEALSVLRLAGGAQGVAHSDRFRSVFQVVRAVRVSVLLLLALLHVDRRGV